MEFKKTLQINLIHLIIDTEINSESKTKNYENIKQQSDFKSIKNMEQHQSPYITLYVARHAQTEDNIAKIQPTHNTELSALGVEQANKLATKLSEVKFDFIYTSDSHRCKKTVEIV